MPGDGLGGSPRYAGLPPSEEQVQSARVPYHEARELHRQGRLKEALERALEAYRIASTPVTALEAGQLLVEAGRLVEARDIVRSVAAFPVSPRESDKGREARQGAAALRRRFGRAHSEDRDRGARRPGVDVALDGKPLAASDPTAWLGVDPGRACGRRARGGPHVRDNQRDARGGRGADNRSARRGVGLPQGACATSSDSCKRGERCPAACACSAPLSNEAGDHCARNGQPARQRVAMGRDRHRWRGGRRSRRRWGHRARSEGELRLRRVAVPRGRVHGVRRTAFGRALARRRTSRPAS